jgi:hypothetical protein
MIDGMRKQLLPLGAAMAVALGLLTAAPAAASYAVMSITFPGASGEFYSPFTGPATVTFTFDGSENDATFELRLRLVGGGVVRKKTVFIDPDTQTSPRSIDFSWPALSVTSAKTYQVAVYRNGTRQGSPENFLLRPPLVSITGATPNPFLPLIDDGHKDTTKIKFNLVSDADAEARVFRANSSGKCCGNLVRDDTGLNNLSAGPNEWVWDGKNDLNSEAGVGDYFVRIWADDGVVAPVLSKAFKVSIARTYRARTTLEKSATAYHHVGPVTSYLRGGNCFLTKAQTDLWITCLHAKITIYWRWSLPAGGRVESVSWTFLPLSVPCRFTKGHTTTDSWMRAGVTSGQMRCRVDKAKITYSRPVQS